MVQAGQLRQPVARKIATALVGPRDGADQGAFHSLPIGVNPGRWTHVTVKIIPLDEQLEALRNT